MREEASGWARGVWPVPYLPNSNPAGSHLLPDLQGPLAQWLGLLVLAPLAIQNCQVVQCCSHLQGWEPEGPDPGPYLAGTLGPAGSRGQRPHHPCPSLTAGWSFPSVFSLMARASLSRWAASLYLFWSLGAGRNMLWVVLQPKACPQGPMTPAVTDVWHDGTMIQCWEAWAAPAF